MHLTRDKTRQLKKAQISNYSPTTNTILVVKNQGYDINCPFSIPNLARKLGGYGDWQTELSL